MGSLPIRLVWLVLAMCPSISICAMGATPMFADCNSIVSNFTNSSGGGNFEAIGCNYPASETLVSLGLGAGTTATVYIANGKVAAGASARLTVQCPPTVISQSLHITVTGIAFGQDASFRFTGALPPRSSLHISNNTFFLTRQNLNTFPAESSFFTPAILIGDWATALVIVEGTAMLANNNTVTCLWVEGSNRVVAINVIGTSATLQSASIVSISDNRIINSNFSSDAYVAYLNLYSDSSFGGHLSLSNLSHIAMGGNSISNSSFNSYSVYAAYVSLYNYYSSNLTLSNQSHIAMGGNSIVNSQSSFNSTDAYQTYVAYLNFYSHLSSSLTLSEQSAIAMSGNSIINSSFSFSNNAYVAFLSLTSYYSINSFTLSNQSAIAMSGNSIVNSSDAFVAFLYLNSDSSGSGSGSSSSSLTLSNLSAIAMSGNSIMNSSFSRGTYVAYLVLYSGSLTLSYQSAITMSGNSIVNASIDNGAGAYLLLYSYYSSITITLSNQSAITMSGNTIMNSSFCYDIYVAFLQFHSYYSSITITLSNQSAIAMSGNTIMNSFSNYYMYVAYLNLYYDRSSRNLALSNRSAIAMSGNTVMNSSFSRGTYVAYLNLYSYRSSINLTLSDHSAIAMSGNSCSQVSTAAIVLLVVIEVTGPISLEGMASVSIDINNAYVTYVTYAASAVLRISAWNISLNDSSRISLTGNILQAPLGRLASLLTISPSSGSGVLSISGNSCLIVALNDIIADAVAISVTMKVSAEYPSTIAIVDNHIGGYVSGFAGFSELYLNGEMLAAGNSVEAPSPIATFLLATLTSTFINGSMASVRACGNYLSWVGHIQDPKLYLQPTAFAALASQCLTPTLGLLASHRIASSTKSVALDDRTWSQQPARTEQQYLSKTIDLSNTSPTTEPPNGFATNSSSATLTRSMSNTTSIEPTKSQVNCSIGDICQLVKVASDQSALFDTCTEPGPTETAAKNSTYLPLARYIGNAKQAAIQSSYQGPALSGSAFYYGSVVVLWPEGMANVTHVEAASPSIAACWVFARSANGTEIRVVVEALPVAAGTALDPASVPVVLMDLTLNVSCGAVTVVFNRTIAIERPVVYLPKVFVPEKAVHDAATITGALSVTVGAVAVPIAAMQQGVALALLRMAQCEEDALNGEPLDVSVHPLQFGLGGGAGKYGRGALLGNLLVIPAIWCALMYLLVPFAIQAVTDRTLDASRDFVGWPSMALMPLAVLSEGSAMASVGLLAQGGAGDIIMGLIGLAILLVATACWAAELWRMRRQVQLRRASSVASWVKAVHPRFEWERGGKTDGANSSYLDKRIQLLSSSWWLWSALAAQLLSIVVGVAEGLPIGPNLCRARWAVASLAAVLQAAVVMTNTVPVELLLLGVIGVITCVLVVLIALSTFDVVSPGSTFSALNAVGMANSVLGISLIVVGALAAAYESVHRRSKRENESSRPLARNLNDLPPSPDVPPNSVPSLYSGIPSILGDTELREAADGKYVALEPVEL